MRRSVVLRVAFRSAIAAAVIAIAPAAAVAQTDVMRMPEGANLQTREGHPDEILMGTTLGPLLSDDGGITWKWICENAVGYGGNYDPDYVYSPSGAIFATTYNGIAVSRDHCTFAPTALGLPIAQALTMGPDHTIYVGMSEPGNPTTDPPILPDHKVYRSTNDGVDWDAGLELAPGEQSWTSMKVAPSDAQRVYLTGYTIGTGGVRTLYVYRSINGGDSYTELATTDFTFTDQSQVFVMAISLTDPDRVLARVTRYQPNNLPGDEFFLSTNGGTSWTSVLETPDTARSALFLPGDDVVIGSRDVGNYVSTTAGASFTMVAGAQPQVFCLHERPDGEVWACTEPYADPPFDAGVMKTTAAATTWAPVMRYEDDIIAPADCPTGTIQRDCCVDESPACPIEFPSTWCRLRVSLQVVADPTDCLAPDANMAGADNDGQPPKGCCDTGGGGGPVGPTVLMCAVAWNLRRRRRRVRELS